jgi:flagella synthesis protein FlgN
MTQVIIDINKLSKNINNLLELLTQFEDSLNLETSILNSSDTSALTNIVLKKQKIAEQIELLFLDISQNTQDKNFSLHSFMAADDFKLLPLDIKKTFKKTSLKVAACYDKNTANGISLQALNNLNKTLLQLFKGQDPKNKTYTSSGGSTSATNTPNSLGKA